MPHPPFFSVIVPTYNHAQYVGSALDSLLAQSESDWEAVVVNDGSTDDSLKVMQTYSESDSRIRVFSKPNGGVASALNRGIAEARGEWICWLSSDDLFERRKLEIHRHAIQEHPDCRFFFSHFRELDDSSGEILDVPLWRTIPEQEWQVLEMLACTYIHGNSICIHREAMARTGWFNEELRYGQDYDMWLRLLSLFPARFIPERTCITRRHPGQESSSFFDACFFDSAKAAINFLNEHPFSSLVPWTDLTDPDKAYEAVDKALRVAMQPSGFLYTLGAHPALFWRIMEWAWSEDAREAAGLTQSLVRQRLKRMQKLPKNSTFPFFGKVLTAACALPEGRFDYQAISPGMVAEWGYSALRSIDKTKADSLLRYINRFLKPFSNNRPPAPKDSKEVVIVCQQGQKIPHQAKYGTLKATLSLARFLTESGRMVVLVGWSDQRIGIFDGVFFLGANNEKSMMRAVRLLGPKDTIIGISRGDMVYMGRAKRLLVYHHGPHHVQGITVAMLNKAGMPTVCVSDYSRSEQRDFGVRDSLLHVVPNGLDNHIFRNANPHSRNQRGLVFAGHIVHYKGFDIALRAFEMIRKSFPDATFSAYGQTVSWQQSSDHHFAQEWLDAQGMPIWPVIERDLPGFRHCGEVPSEELAHAFHENSLLVMPSRIGETFGIVLVEAQACGCLPVVPRKGGFPETLCQGETGYLYDDDTSEGLARCVTSLWKTGLPTEDQRRAAEEWAWDRFSWERSHEAFLGIMESMSKGYSVTKLLSLLSLRIWEYAYNKLLRPSLGVGRSVGQ